MMVAFVSARQGGYRLGPGDWCA